MAKAGDKPKSLKIAEQKSEEIQGWEDPVKDRYKFEKTMKKLSENGYPVEKESGVIMVDSPLDNFSAVEKIIKSCKFEGSWGIKHYTKTNKKLDLVIEEE